MLQQGDIGECADPYIKEEKVKHCAFCSKYLTILSVDLYLTVALGGCHSPLEITVNILISVTEQYFVHSFC